MDLFWQGLAIWEHFTITQGWVFYYSLSLVSTVDVRLPEEIIVNIWQNFLRYRYSRIGSQNHFCLRVLQSEAVVQRHKGGNTVQIKRGKQQTILNYHTMCCILRHSKEGQLHRTKIHRTKSLISLECRMKQGYVAQVKDENSSTG